VGPGFSPDAYRFNASSSQSDGRALSVKFLQYRLNFMDRENILVVQTCPG